jgi:hypothetical protein
LNGTLGDTRRTGVSGNKKLLLGTRPTTIIDRAPPLPPPPTTTIDEVAIDEVTTDEVGGTASEVSAAAV